MRPLDFSRLIMSVGIPVAIFPLTFWLQLQLGYEVSLFPLYMLPIAALSWSFGLPGAFLSVTLATGLWFWGNILSGYEYTYDWARYYNTGARCLIFVMVAVFIILFKRVVQQHMRRMEAMRALLNVCHGCGSVQGSDGRWIPFDQLTVPASRPACECPECARLAQAIGGAKRPVASQSAPMPFRTEHSFPMDTKAGIESDRAGNRPWQPGDPDRRKNVRREEDR